jgi:glutamine amidotransferase PdxT
VELLLAPNEAGESTTMIHLAGAGVSSAEEVIRMRNRIWAVLAGLMLVAVTAVPSFASVIWGS